MTTNERLEYFRSQINAEQISMAEVLELQDMADEIDPGDTQLLEWAGVPEFIEENYMEPEQPYHEYIYEQTPEGLR